MNEWVKSANNCKAILMGRFLQPICFDENDSQYQEFCISSSSSSHEQNSTLNLTTRSYKFSNDSSLCDEDLKIEFETSVDMCDDQESGCVSPPGSKNCRVHKHQLCDGVFDCNDSSDEVNDICSHTTAGFFKCDRKFPGDLIRQNVSIPVSWLMDNQSDCVDGSDEIDTGLVRTCGEGASLRQILLSSGDECPEVFYCPGDDKNRSIVELDYLCDGRNSCDNGIENEVCVIARDSPIRPIYNLKSAAIGNHAIRDLCTLVGPYI